MNQETLNKILENHKKWIDSDGAEGQRANLQEANLQRANLQEADLRWADLQRASLQRADLQRANLDYSCLPLWCGSREAHMDDRQVIQLLYHTLSIVHHSPHVSQEVKDALLTDANLAVANRFHRVEECGELRKED